MSLSDCNSDEEKQRADPTWPPTPTEEADTSLPSPTVNIRRFARVGALYGMPFGILMSEAAVTLTPEYQGEFSANPSTSVLIAFCVAGVVGLLCGVVFGAAFGIACAKNAKPPLQWHWIGAKLTALVMVIMDVLFLCIAQTGTDIFWPPPLWFQLFTIVCGLAVGWLWAWDYSKVKSHLPFMRWLKPSSEISDAQPAIRHGEACRSTSTS